uniref:Trypsin-1-like n=1 Tax=Hirondellea gigas TaxID=1518452 RepID=A0A2P2HX16_9CRUS
MSDLWNLCIALVVLLWARPGSCKVTAGPREMALMQQDETSDRDDVPSGTCSTSPTRIHLNPGDVSDFTSPNYPNRYPGFTKCSYKFHTDDGYRFAMHCSTVQMAWFSTLYMVDNGKTTRKGCFICTDKPYDFTFSSNHAEVGLDNGFVFSSKGFNCRMRVEADPAPGTDCKCGVPNRVTRIVGGHETQVNEYPWMVMLVTPSTDFNFCGGSLITSRHVLTAAHCTSSGSPSSIGIRLGVHRTNNYPNEAEYRVVKKIDDHPSYTGATKGNDVSVLTIDSVDLSPSSTVTIRPICLPVGTSDDYVGVQATVSGWGRTTSGGSSPGVLYEVQVPVISNVQCLNSYSQITDTMVCAGETDKDSCQGDSGGPMWASSPNSQYMVEIGIVSWGRGCGWTGYPGVYSRVTALLPWIQSIIGDTATCPPPS